MFFIGRGIDYAISLEGSLKLKEISYIHSEAYAAGELKHGTISLIEEGTLVAAVSTQPELYAKTISNMVEDGRMRPVDKAARFAFPTFDRECHDERGSPAVRVCGKASDSAAEVACCIDP